ncbi:toxin-antitoxin system HicB family antitoxin [Candidatus Thiodictyon syntrophicum]|jgi:hypothetical protein|uniref:CopG family transcriptional regulator n=1 Tax=Candidatus Thiodictyon syntrophicum TaxID=1166950 RepID=A0A2K8U455_9GAMM|nr:toxin-antitoxin system HicB family antitoxin [Candidatus Thiodictyon syntrophicum]AUB80374.1 CopG family transcriptional regulator [Candidatus Thiodictyon syntrophicum]
MTSLTISIPDSLHKSIQAMALKEGISVNQFIASAAGEKMASLLTLDYLRQEAAVGRRDDFERFLAAVPDRAADPGDELGTALPKSVGATPD